MKGNNEKPSTCLEVAGPGSQLLSASDLPTRNYRSMAASRISSVPPGRVLSSPLPQPIVHVYACPFVYMQTRAHIHYPKPPPHVTSHLVLLDPTSPHLACEKTTILYNPGWLIAIMRMTVGFPNIYLFPQTTKVVALASDSWHCAHRPVPSGLSAEKDHVGMQAWAQMTGPEKQCLCQAKAISPAQSPPLREPGLRRGLRGGGVNSGRNGLCLDTVTGS